MAILASLLGVSLLGVENKAEDLAQDIPAHAVLAARKSARAFLTHCFSVSRGRRGPSRPRPLSRGFTMLLSSFGAVALALALNFTRTLWALWTLTAAEPVEAAHVRG
jgi:hypothetical protein